MWAVAWRLPIVIGVCSVAVFAVQVPARTGEPITCGGLYSVVRGDTLRQIAIRAYRSDDYLTIFNANREVLDEPGLIEVGDLLFIPCKDGSGPKTRGEALAATRASQSGLTRLGVPEDSPDVAAGQRSADRLVQPGAPSPALSTPTRRRGPIEDRAEVDTAGLDKPPQGRPRGVRPESGGEEGAEHRKPAPDGTDGRADARMPNGRAVTAAPEIVETPALPDLPDAAAPRLPAAPSAPALPALPGPATRQAAAPAPSEPEPETAATEPTPDATDEPSVSAETEPVEVPQTELGEAPSLPNLAHSGPAAPSAPSAPAPVEVAPASPSLAGLGPVSPSAPSSPAAPESPAGLAPPAIDEPEAPRIATLPNIESGAAESVEPTHAMAPAAPSIAAVAEAPAAFAPPTVAQPSAAVPATGPIALAAAGGGSLAPAMPAPTDEPTCGAFYEVRRGDTLSKIATRAYGDWRYRGLFNANRDIIDDPSLIEIGDLLFIPCKGGSGPQTRVAALEGAAQRPVAAPPPGPATRPEIPARREVILAPVTIEPPELRAPSVEAGAAETPLASAPVSTAPAAPSAGADVGVPFRPSIRFLTGSGRAPLTGEELPEGGMLTDLVRRAMAAADPDMGYRVTFIDDWRPHLPILLSEGAFDVGFGWFRPNCAVFDRLTAESRARCTDFDYSSPFYELVVGVYALSDGAFAAVSAPAELRGKRICRPAAFFTFDLEEMGLGADAAVLVRPRRPEDCFALLRSGEVDVVTMNVLTADEAIAAQHMQNRTVLLDALSSIRTVHAVAAKSNPFGRTYLELLNQGLRKLQGSGEWFALVSRHLSDHAKRLR